MSWHYPKGWTDREDFEVSQNGNPAPVRASRRRSTGHHRSTDHRARRPARLVGADISRSDGGAAGLGRAHAGPGSSPRLDDRPAVAALQIAEGLVPDELRTGGGYARSIPPPVGAGPYERLAAFLGRTLPA